MRKVLHHLVADVVEQIFLLFQPLVGEIAHDETDCRLLQCAADAYRVQKTLPAFGGLRRAAILWQAVDDARGDSDGVLHLDFGKARMRADALNGDGDAIGRKRLVLDIARGLAVDGIGEIGSKLRKVDLVHPRAVFSVRGEQDLNWPWL